MMDSQCRYFRWTNKAVVKNSCSDCAAYRVCAFKGGTAPVCSVLDSMIEEELYLEKGSVVCNSSQPARDLYAVRSGALKECTIDRAGKERVIEFYFQAKRLDCMRSVSILTAIARSPLKKALCAGYRLTVCLNGSNTCRGCNRIF